MWHELVWLYNVLKVSSQLGAAEDRTAKPCERSKAAPWDWSHECSARPAWTWRCVLCGDVDFPLTADARRPPQSRQCQNVRAGLELERRRQCTFRCGPGPAGPAACTAPRSAHELWHKRAATDIGDAVSGWQCQPPHHLMC